MPEVDLCRESLTPYCRGNGLDIGFGGCAILSSAICIDRSEDNPERAQFGSPPTPTHLVGDATSLFWFADGVLDYVFSSHVLEDFIDTEVVLQEWLRVIKPGGNLVLFCPDQRVYEDYCRAHGNQPNLAHKHPDFSLSFVKTFLFRLGIDPSDILHEVPLIHAYSWELVVRKPKK